MTGLLAALTTVGCGGDDSGQTRERAGPSEEYRVARVIRTFVVGVYDGDGDAACRVLTPQRQREVTARSRQRTCEKAIAAQSLEMSDKDLDRLGRSRATKVDLEGARGRAQIATPTANGRREQHTVSVVKDAGAWKLASQFFPGELAQGKVPKPPPGPPRNPAEEGKITAVFERFRRALDRGDGRTACNLRTRTARQAAVSQAIEAADGRKQALRDYGKLTCAAVSAGLRIPSGKVLRVTVDGARGRLRLEGGATYGFRRGSGRGRLDS